MPAMTSTKDYASLRWMSAPARLEALAQIRDCKSCADLLAVVGTVLQAHRMRLEDSNLSAAADRLEHLAPDLADLLHFADHKWRTL